VINGVGAENEYANVLGQIGGRYVHVSSILNNPNTDPHTFESSPSVAEEVSAAQLIVQNGVGYDTFMNKIESASPNSARKVIVVQSLLGLPDSTPNPHLWYNPKTMPAAAKAMADDLSDLQPAHAAYFQANLKRFDASLAPWFGAIAAFKAQHKGVAVATTEPVGTGSRLPAQRDGHQEPDAVAVPGRHHERGGSVSAGCDAREWLLHQPHGEGVRL
jgi:zinc/manganese transport system substrate-binding protein